jgi:hypothetical protein
MLAKARSPEECYDRMGLILRAKQQSATAQC